MNLVQVESPRASTKDELAEVRAALEARLDDCWDRLDDVVSELHTLHEVDESLIVERVRAAIVLDDA